MTRRRAKGKIYTVTHAIQFFNDQKYRPNTVKTYTDNLNRIVDMFPQGKTLAEILKDPEDVVKTIKDATVSHDGKKALSLQTMKAYFVLLRLLTKDDKIPTVTDDKATIYEDEMNAYKVKADKQVKQNLKKGKLLKFPKLTWETILQKREEFIKKSYITKKNIGYVVLVSMYMLLKPRRVQEYYTLTIKNLRPKKPDPYENYIVINRNHVELHLGQFKTRTRLEEDKMPVFQTVITGELNKLIKEYVKKTGLNNGDHLFFSGSDHTKEYTQEGFTLAIEIASNKVLGYGLGANDFRHLYVNWIYKHIDRYNDQQLQKIAHEMGDMSTATWQKYRTVEEDRDEPEREQEPEPDMTHDEPEPNVEIETPHTRDDVEDVIKKFLEAASAQAQAQVEMFRLLLAKKK